MAKTQEENQRPGFISVKPPPYSQRYVHTHDGKNAVRLDTILMIQIVEEPNQIKDSTLDTMHVMYARVRTGAREEDYCTVELFRQPLAADVYRAHYWFFRWAAGEKISSAMAAANFYFWKCIPWGPERVERKRQEDELWRGHDSSEDDLPSNSKKEEEHSGYDPFHNS